MNPALRIRHPFRNSALDAPWVRVEQSAERLSLHQSWPEDSGRDFFLVGERARSRESAHAAAIAEQARKLEHPILEGISHDAAEKLVSCLRKWLSPRAESFVSFRRWLDGGRSDEPELGAERCRVPFGGAAKAVPGFSGTRSFAAAAGKRGLYLPSQVISQNELHRAHDVMRKPFGHCSGDGKPLAKV